jgi:hypothetical protein
MNKPIATAPAGKPVHTTGPTLRANTAAAIHVAAAHANTRAPANRARSPRTPLTSAPSAITTRIEAGNMPKPACWKRPLYSEPRWSALCQVPPRAVDQQPGVRMLLPASCRVSLVSGPSSKTWTAIHTATAIVPIAARPTAAVRHGSIAGSGGSTRRRSRARQPARRPTPSSGRAKPPAIATATSGGNRPTSAPLPSKARWAPSARAASAPTTSRANCQRGTAPPGLVRRGVARATSP